MYSAGKKLNQRKLIGVKERHGQSNERDKNNTLNLRSLKEDLVAKVLLKYTMSQNLPELFQKLFIQNLKKKKKKGKLNIHTFLVQSN